MRWIVAALCALSLAAHAQQKEIKIGFIYDLTGPFAGAVLAFFGFIHGAQLGWAVSPQVALGYALFGAVCLAAGMQAQKNPA